MRKRVILCFFGTISRSIKYTHNNHIRNIINIVKKSYDIDIYIFNNNVENILIDDVQQDNNDYKIIDYNYFEEETQDYIDSQISKKILDDSIKFRMRKDYPKKRIQNAIRQMYSEEKVGLFLEKNQKEYDCAIVCNPDNYLLTNINMKHVHNCVNHKNIIYTTSVNDAQGFTNGFYIGSLNPMIKILKRFSILEKLLPTNKDYEYLLKKVFLMHKINRSVIGTKFVKIRSNKCIARQGVMKKAKFNNKIKEIQYLLHTR